MPEHHHVCPVWAGYLLASPIRKLFQNPSKLLGAYVREGMTVIDIGSAMGFFSIPMAKMAGANGRVICVDLQPKMLEVLMRRARKAGVAGRIVPRLCSGKSLEIDDLTGTIDFALASAVVHEVPSPETFFREVCTALKPGDELVVAEPSGHVTSEAFERTIETAVAAGLTGAGRSKYSHYHTVTLRKE